MKNIELASGIGMPSKVVVDGKDLTDMCVGFSVDAPANEAPRVTLILIGNVNRPTVNEIKIENREILDGKEIARHLHGK